MAIDVEIGAAGVEVAVGVVVGETVKVSVVSVDVREMDDG